ncbi:hypothetical protein A2U01_0118803, partial [Trifolium medium]|nr:hypothetical protein [Trifolium medium]
KPQTPSASSPTPAARDEHYLSPLVTCTPDHLRKSQPPAI